MAIRIGQFLFTKRETRQDADNRFITTVELTWDGRNDFYVEPFEITIDSRDFLILAVIKDFLYRCAIHFWGYFKPDSLQLIELGAILDECYQVLWFIDETNKPTAEIIIDGEYKKVDIFQLFIDPDKEKSSFVYFA